MEEDKKSRYSVGVRPRFKQNTVLCRADPSITDVRVDVANRFLLTSDLDDVREPRWSAPRRMEIIEIPRGSWQPVVLDTLHPALRNLNPHVDSLEIRELSLRDSHLGGMAEVWVPCRRKVLQYGAIPGLFTEFAQAVAEALSQMVFDREDLVPGEPIAVMLHPPDVVHVWEKWSRETFQVDIRGLSIEHRQILMGSHALHDGVRTLADSVYDKLAGRVDDAVKYFMLAGYRASAHPSTNR